MLRPVLLATALVLLLAPTAAAEPRDPRLQGVASWAFAIGSGTLDGDVAARYAPFDLVIVDGEEVTKAQVSALRAQGKVVLGYLSIGTIEERFSYAGARSRQTYSLTRSALSVHDALV